MSAFAKKASRQTSRFDSLETIATPLERPASEERMLLSTFSTPLGWMGLLGEGDELASVIIGRASLKSVQAAANKVSPFLEDENWNPIARELLEAYAEGEVVDFSSIQLRLPPMTSFRQKVVAATRRLGYGETVTYGELAARSGHPRAARAVGTVMSMNRFPIVIPCHRVLASGYKLGGYTSPSGTAFKQRLLDIEASSTGAPQFQKRNTR